tara:strand:- start:216 stop:374 length:159 start_codon:yes stop_codon:yes gene_type:complete
MKNKKDIIGFFTLVALALPVFRTSYSPTQAILATIFSYLGIRLCIFVYFKNR